MRDELKKIERTAPKETEASHVILKSFGQNRIRCKNIITGLSLRRLPWLVLLMWLLKLRALA